MDQGLQQVRTALDASAGAARFDGSQLFLDVHPLLREMPQFGDTYMSALAQVGPANEQWLGAAMLRAAFLFEPVNREVTSTKFASRWATRFDGDPRGASFEECWAIFDELLAEVATLGADSEELRLLKRFRRYPALPYELPIDYDERREDGTMHSRDNVVWIWHDPAVERALRLREVLSEPDVVGDLAEVFVKARKKTGVKTYLTDRAQTGATKTNREKRWEAHPASVQFALRRQCLGIERRLLEQICCFDGFPELVREKASGEAGFDGDHEIPLRCPVTRDTLSFKQLKYELLNPKAGKATFQVGHLDPLKGDVVMIDAPEGDDADEGDDEESALLLKGAAVVAASAVSGSGHAPANVSWISADGNRIQGALSFVKMRELLERITQNYTEHPPPDAV